MLMFKCKRVRVCLFARVIVRMGLRGLAHVRVWVLVHWCVLARVFVHLHERVTEREREIEREREREREKIESPKTPISNL